MIERNPVRMCLYGPFIECSWLTRYWTINSTSNVGFIQKLKFLYLLKCFAVGSSFPSTRLGVHPTGDIQFPEGGSKGFSVFPLTEN